MPLELRYDVCILIGKGMITSVSTHYESIVGQTGLFSLRTLTSLGVELWYQTRFTSFNDWLWFGLVWSYGISTILCYLMVNLYYTYISNIWFLNTFFRYHFWSSLSPFFLELNDFTYFIRTILFAFNHLLARSVLFSSTAMKLKKNQSFVYTVK